MWCFLVLALFQLKGDALVPSSSLLFWGRFFFVCVAELYINEKPNATYCNGNGVGGVVWLIILRFILSRKEGNIKYLGRCFIGNYSLPQKSVIGFRCCLELVFTKSKFDRYKTLLFLFDGYLSTDVVFFICT